MTNPDSTVPSNTRDYDRQSIARAFQAIDRDDVWDGLSPEQRDSILDLACKMADDDEGGMGEDWCLQYAIQDILPDEEDEDAET